jgi:hypothetical protein
MNAREHESLRELAAAPELAHVTALLLAIDLLLRALRVAHGPIDHEPPPTDAPAVLWAAEVIARARALRHAAQRYRATVLRGLRPPMFHHDADDIF